MRKEEVLKKYFGYDSFREGQETLIEGILQGRDVLGIMPTGSGKSLCFQVPALMLEGITSRGTLDSHYRGTVRAVLYNHSKEGYPIHRGDKLCQVVIAPIEIPELERVDRLDETDRNEGGFGSSGKQ